MPTGDSFVNLVLKRFLSQSRMNGNFLNYLQDMFYDGISRIFPSQGMFTYPFVLTNNGDGTFTVATDPLIGTDGEGHVLKLTGSTRTDNIPFEDTAATYYWVGMHYIEVPSGVQTNPRTGQVEYDLILEEIGELNNPTSVADGGSGTIDIVVDSIFENGVDYSGREVRVWLTDPMSADSAVAFETLTVSYDGGSGENSVTTSGLLGQSSLSVATADYQVAALGVSVKKSATNPWTSDPYCIVGYVEGSSSNETTTDAVDLSGGGGHTLQKAYDGAGGSGDGRDISVQNEAIVLDQQNLTLAAQDVFHAPLRLIKDGDRSAITNPTSSLDAKDTEGGVDVLQRMMALYAFMCRVNLVDGSGNDFLFGSEAAEITGGPNIITLTRAGVDLTFTGATPDLIMDYDYVELVNSSNADDGIYLITAVNTTDLAVLNLDGTTPSFTGESGTSLQARIYRPIMKVNTYDFVTDDQVGLLLSSVDGFTVDYGGNYYIPLKIVGAPGSDPSTAMIWVTNATSGDIFTVRYDGRIDARGVLDMNGNDIDTEGGGILSGTGTIDSEGGIIQSGAGTIDSEGGIIQSGTGTIDSEGGIIQSGGGLIDSEGGDIESGGGDILTQGGDFVAATPGNVTASGGNVTGSYVLALGDITADSNANGTGDFLYGQAKTPYMMIPFDAFVESAGTFSYSGGAVTCVTDGTLAAPIWLPNGVTITGFDIKMYDAGGDASMAAYILRRTSNLDSPSTAPTFNTASSPSVTTATSDVWTVESKTGLNISSDDVKTFVMVTTMETGDKFGGCRLTVSYDQVYVV